MEASLPCRRTQTFLHLSFKEYTNQHRSSVAETRGQTPVLHLFVITHNVQSCSGYPKKTTLNKAEWLLHASWPLRYTLSVAIGTTCLTLSSWLAPGLFLQGYHYLTSHSPFSDFKPKPCKSLLLNFIFPHPTTFPVFQNFDFYPILKMPSSSLSSTTPSASLRDIALHHPSWSWFYREREISFYYVKRRTYILAGFATRPAVFL